MTYQTVFKRYEIKFLLDLEQKQRILAAMEPYMVLDEYGRTTIRNVYFDTDNFRLIRRSLEHPAYKEKLRIRSYKQLGPDEPVFVELKKKYNGVVYKRRLALPEKEAMQWLRGETCSQPGHCNRRKLHRIHRNSVRNYYGRINQNRRRGVPQRRLFM